MRIRRAVTAAMSAAAGDIDKALVGSTDTPIANVTRLENFGSPSVHWSRVTVDPTGPELFMFSPGIVGANLVENTPR